ncbi:Gfo/Idh/MocA family oxidoreductase [Pseudomonas fildesensis]|uniref:Gfo/Idh/MocA family oxidoreductase n=1 Tax=Pseudomonas fildesensis TaxID=1674920 RepID=UPI00387A8D89
MLNFLLIGAGQLGSRHLQALALSDFADISIQVVEPSSEARRVAQERWEQVAKSEKIKAIEFLEDISSVNRSIDFCIVATNANCRLQVLRELLGSVSVRQLVLEKVLFQSVEQVDEAGSLLSSQGTQVWVNCPRRMFPIYIELKKRLSHEQTLNLQVHGNNWGLACNAIHFIDLWAMLGGEHSYTLDTSGLDVAVVESKRLGYKEVSGTLSGVADKHRFSLTSEASTEVAPLSINIETEQFSIEVNESKGQCIIQTKETGRQEALEFSVLYQSQLSHEVARQLLASADGQCELTPFDESASLHVPFLHGLLEFFNKQGDCDHTLCPIT